MGFKLIFALALLATAAFAEKARFDNYRLYRIRVESVAQLEVLQAVQELNEGYNFWSEPAQVDSDVDLVVPPHKFAEFEELVERFGLKAKLNVEDLQKLFDEEQRRPTKEAFGWNAYYRLGEIYAWMDGLLAQYPNVLSPINVGNSFEGRPIRGIKVSYKSGNPGVFMEGTIHAREWVSGATVTWVLNELLTSTNSQVRNIAENYDWYFFPVTNPDGYEFTHTNNRMWRKTRQPHGILCTGADPNRNWAYNFMRKYTSDSRINLDIKVPNQRRGRCFEQPVLGYLRRTGTLLRAGNSTAGGLLLVRAEHDQHVPVIPLVFAAVAAAVRTYHCAAG